MYKVLVIHINAGFGGGSLRVGRYGDLISGYEVSLMLKLCGAYLCPLGINHNWYLRIYATDVVNYPIKPLLINMCRVESNDINTGIK